MIRAESTIEVAQPASAVFGFVEDFSKAPSWLEGCVELTQTSPGQHRIGSALRYLHRVGGRPGEMSGLITEWDEGRSFTLGLEDARFEVTFEVRVSRASAGTIVRHAIEILPKSFVGRLMSPLIGMGNRRQVRQNLARLTKELSALTASASGYDAWTCPFCNSRATQQTAARVLCDSRTCACGAIALAAPACDMDEIIDDAVGVFGVGIREDTRGYDSLILENVRMAGVEIRHGQTVAIKRSGSGKPRDYKSLWFLKSAKR